MLSWVWVLGTEAPKIVLQGIARKDHDIILENTYDDNMNSIVGAMVHRVLEAFCKTLVIQHINIHDTDEEDR